MIKIFLDPYVDEKTTQKLIEQDEVKKLRKSSCKTQKKKNDSHPALQPKPKQSGENPSKKLKTQNAWTESNLVSCNILSDGKFIYFFFLIIR